MQPGVITGDNGTGTPIVGGTGMGMGMGNPTVKLELPFPILPTPR